MLIKGKIKYFTYNNNLFVANNDWAIHHLMHASSKKTYLELASKFNLSRSKIYLDCGSAFGTEAIPFHDLFEKIYAFEPNSDNFSLLKVNVKFYDNIVIDETALNYFSGKTFFYDYLMKSTVGNLKVVGVRSTFTARKFKKTLVKCRTLDSYNFQDVGFIKIDVEGAENYVLKGAIKTLENNSPLIRIEITNDHQDVLDLLLNLGYNPVAFDCSGSIYYLNDTFKFHTISNGDVFWSCDGVTVTRKDLTMYKSSPMHFPYYPYGMNPCQGDFWFLKTKV